jgi:glycine cleavage system H protein
MSNESIPAGLKYTTDHEWAKVEGGEIVVGITRFAVEQLGDITLVNFDVKEGAAVTAGKAFGSVESVKSVSDLLAPASGKVVKTNPALESKPELINEDCYGEGWMVRIALADAKSLDGLMDAAAYAEHVKSSG